MTSVVNRYYDPDTDQFMSLDPDIAETNQPYVFTNDDPLNAEDPMGLRPDPCLGTWVKTSSGMSCENVKNVDKENTLSLIEESLDGLGLTGTEIKTLAKEISTKLDENGGKAISSRTANLLDAEAGIGGNLAKFAGVGGAVVTLAGDLANGDNLTYSAADTGIQVGAGIAGGAAGTAACLWAGPGDAVCAGVGFVAGLLSSWGAGAAFHYEFGKYAQ